MALLAPKTKQSAETRGLLFNFEPWFANRTDSPASYVVVADSGLTVEGSELVGQKVKVAVSGGTSGQRYKVTVRLSTNSSPTIVKEADCYVTVRDV